MTQFGNITNSGKARISSPFGPRNIGGKASKNHKGIDLSYPSGTEITAPLDGVIEKATLNAGNCGGIIFINHGTFNGKTVKTKYCHAKRLDIEKGEQVKKGQVLGLSGGGKNDVGRGNAMGAHIHFEVWENGTPVNPKSYYENSISGDQSDITIIPDKKTNDTGDDTKDSSSFDKIKSLYGDDGDEKEMSSEEDSENKTKELTKKIFKKIFGVESVNSKNSDKMVNEIKTELERFNFLIKEQVLVVDNQKIEKTSEGTFYKGSANSIVKSLDKGKITKLTNLGTYEVGVKIGNTEMYWKGTLNDGLNQISIGTSIGRTTDGIVFSKVIPSTDANNGKQNNSVNSTVKSAANTSGTSTSSPESKDADSKSIVQGVVRQMFGQNESVEDSENILNEEINRIKNLIK